MPALSLSVYLTIALALSLAGNAGLAWMLKGAWQETATAESSYEQAKASAVQCSEGVAKLARATAEREAKAKAALQAAQGAARFHEQAAMVTLQTRPSKPEDQCGSALELSRAKAIERRSGIGR